MLLDHIGIRVKDFKKSYEMYEALLTVFGLSIQLEGDGYAGFGTGEHTSFWISGSDGNHPHSATDVHIAFTAISRDMVNDFHTKGIEVGFKDNGKPGIREMYGPTYYACFLVDNDGNNIEAVCRI